MRPELRATAQCLLPARNVVDEKTLHLKIITQHRGECRLSATSKSRGLSRFDLLIFLMRRSTITQINEIAEANIFDRALLEH